MTSPIYIPPIYIEDGRGSRRIEESHFPLTVGGAEADIEIPEFHAAQPIAHLGLSDGEVFIQPREGGPEVVCNGTSLATSHWLRDGDVLRIGVAQIVVEMKPEATRLRVERRAEDFKTDPPRVAFVAPARGSDTDVLGTAVKPVAFEPTPIASAARSRRTWRRRELYYWTIVAFLGAIAWFVFTARSVLIEVEPSPDRVEIEGSFLVLDLGDRHLLRPGSYTVVVEKEGYRRAEIPVEVTREPSQSFHFSLERLPGILAVSTAPVEGAAVWVDGENVGVTPLDDLELHPGDHDVLIRAEHYQDLSTTVRVEGGGVVTTLKAELVGRWAPITFNSEPAGATVRVDGETVGATPVTADLLEGSHAYELILRGHKPYRSRVAVVAGESRTLPPVRLDPADGNLVLHSDPTEANVTVDGVYQGQTPLDLDLAPGKTHEITVSRAGYEPQSRQVRLRSGESDTLSVELAARMGQIEIVIDPPDAELYVNGEPRGRANQVVRLIALPQQIEIRKQGYESFSTTVTPRPGFPQSIEVTLKTIEEAKAEARLPVIKTSQGQELHLIGPRRFRMGASRREPGRRANEAFREVELTRYYYLATQEVSNRQFREFQTGHRSGSLREFKLELDDLPVVRVSWEAAAQYCNWLSARESLPPAYVQKDEELAAAVPLTTGYRLPTEAEWAAAARYPDGQSALKYPWGNSLPVPPGSGNFADVSARGLVATTLPKYNDSFPVTAPVGSFEPNALGLFNLGGNVAEWMHDYYTIRPSSGSEVARDPLGPKEGKFHVIRGSSWMDGSVTELRLSARDYGKKARPDVGFRIARYAE